MKEFDFQKNLEKLERAFEKPDIFELKWLSNSIIREAGFENNKAAAKIAIIAYCLYKLLTKEHIIKNRNWKNVKKSISKNIDSALRAARQKDYLELEKKLDLALKGVDEIDKDLGFFLTSLFDKAKIKLASTAYVTGLSLGQAAELTGADKKQLLQYLGNTTINEEKIPKIGIAERIEKIKNSFLKRSP
ncbi:MAG: hypothetical protein PHD95_03860 [Candidatus ainarchaeum sp.]|nr:hypothetical protein [Candidatus ainarchaeum sp.]